VTFFEGLSRLNHQAEEVVIDMNDMEVRIHEAGWEWKKTWVNKTSTGPKLTI